MTDANKTDRRRVLMFVLLGVAVVAIPGRIAWSMRAGTVAEADQVREQTRLVREQVAQARHDQARSAELNDQLQLLAAAMPADADLPSVVDALSALATESNVVWKSSAQTPPAAKEASRAADTTTTVAAAAKAPATTVPTDDGTGAAATAASPAASGSYVIEVDVSGTSAALTTYLEKIRSLTRLLTVERLSLAWTDGDTGGSNTQAVTAHLSIKAYSWAGAPKPVAGATTTSATAP